MGLNCKPIGKDKSIFKKQENELAKKAAEMLKSKENKSSEKN